MRTENTKETILFKPKKTTSYFFKSIAELKPFQKEWNEAFYMKETSTFDGLLFQADALSNDQQIGNTCHFFYFMSKDEQGKIILATYFTVQLIKEDIMLSPEESFEYEQIRKKDPYYATANAIMSGSPLSDGQTFFVKDDHPSLKEAVNDFCEAVFITQKNFNANITILRDFPDGKYETFKNLLGEKGFLELPIGYKYEINNLEPITIEGVLQKLKSNYRRHVKKDIVNFLNLFDIDFVSSPIDRQELDHCYNLYLNVKRSNLTINTFEFSRKIFDHINVHPSWEIMRIYLKEHTNQSSRWPVAVGFAYNDGNSYGARIVGLDYKYLYSHKIYKQALFHSMMRARTLGLKRISLGFTADLEKKKIGCKGTMCSSMLMRRPETED